jgi:hypothetical protein
VVASTCSGHSAAPETASPARSRAWRIGVLPCAVARRAWRYRARCSFHWCVALDSVRPLGSLLPPRMLPRLARTGRSLSCRTKRKESPP